MKLNSFKKPQRYDIMFGIYTSCYESREGKTYFIYSEDSTELKYYTRSNAYTAHRPRTIKRRLKQIPEGCIFEFNTWYKNKKTRVPNLCESKYFIKTKKGFKRITEDEYWEQ